MLSQGDSATLLRWDGDSLNEQGVLKAKWILPKKADIKEQQVLYFRGAACDTPILPAAHVGASETSHTATFTPEDGVEYTFRVFTLLTNGSISSSSCSNPITYLGAFSIESLSQSLINENNVAAAPFKGLCLLGSQIQISAAGSPDLKTFTCTNRDWNENVDLSSLPSLFNGDLVIQVTPPGGGTAKEYRLAITKDVVPPTITLDALPVIMSLNQGAYLVSGSCSENARAVSLAVGSLTDSVLCAGGVFSKALDVSALTGASVTITVTHADAVGNSRTDTTTVNRDVSGPVVNSLALNGGAAATNSLSVTLDSSVSDVTEMYITNSSGCSVGGSWTAYEASASWTLPSANATNTVYAKFRDANGNETSCLSDEILHDNIAPTLSISLPLAGAVVHSGNVTAFTVSGSCSEDGRSITFSGPGGFSGTTVCAGVSFSAILDLTSIPQGSFELTASMTDVAGNVGNATSPTYEKDTVAPTGSLAINGGAPTTNDLAVTLGLTSADAADMYITNTAACATGGTWESFAASKGWNLQTADATNTVYVKYRDAAGNESACYSASITHTTTVPSLSLASPTDGSYINLANVSAFAISGACSEDGQPVTIAVTGLADTSATCSSGSWSKTLDLSSVGQGNVTFTLNHERGNGAAAPEVNKTFTKDTIAPTVDSFAINDDDVYTTALGVTLSSTTTDGTQMYVTNAALCLSGGTWETYSASKAWTLPTPNDTNTVYFKVRDLAGNESACAFDSIIHDAVTPTISLASPSSGSYINSLNQAAFALSGTCSENGQPVALSVTGHASVTAEVACAANAWSATMDLSSLADTSGTPYTIVASHSRASGNSATDDATYPKDTVSPGAATLTGAPTGTNTVGTLDVTVGGADISHYRYFVVAPDDTEVCTNSAAYTGSDIAVGTKITDALTGQGAYKLCVFGRDAAGNWASATSQTTWVRDTQGPVILNVDATNANGTYEVGQTLQIRVNFDENVTVTGNPRLTLEMGDTDRDAVYVSGSGSTSLLFEYVIQIGDHNDDLDYVSTSALSLSGGSLKDALNNDASLALPAPGSANSLAGTKNLVIDAYSSPLAKAVLSNAPMGVTAATALNITVTGLDVVAYKYKMGLASATNCAVADDYSAEIGAATLITDDFSSYDEAAILKVCVLGKDSSGKWQKLFEPTHALWHRGTETGDLPSFNLCGATKSTTEPKGRLYDSGGPTGDYGNNETVANCYFAINTGSPITGTVSYDIEPHASHAYDFLRMRETNASGSIIFGPVSGVGSAASVNSTSGTLYVEFKSDSSVVKSGFELTWGFASVSPVFALNNYTNATVNTSYTRSFVVSNLGAATVFSVSGYDAELRNVTTSEGFASSIIVNNGDTVEIRMTSPNAADQFRLAHLRAGDVDKYWTVATPLTATTVTHVTSNTPDGTYGPGDTVDIQVVFNKPVIVSGAAPVMSLNSGATATYYSGSGSTTLTFRYLVAYQHLSADLNYSSVTLTNATSIKDVVNFNATATLPALASADSLGGRKDIVIAGYPTVIAVLSNPPLSNDPTTVLDVTVGGVNAANYRYKVGTSATTDCSVETDYSVARPVATKITDDLSGLPDERLKLCVIAQHTDGSWQLLWHATEYQWDRFATGTYTMCSSIGSDLPNGFIYDSGGPSGQYGNNQNCEFTINTGAPITLTFTAFITESNWDKLSIFDGTSSGTVLLDQISGSTVPVAQTANSGLMTLRFTSDNSQVRDGWVASWGTPGPASPYMIGSLNFTRVDNAALNTRYVSNTVTLGTIDQPTLASVSGGDVQIRNVTANSYWGASVPVVSGQQVQLRMTSPAANAQTQTATIKVGSTIGAWQIHTPYPAPTPVLSGYPQGMSMDAALNVTVAGFRVTQYKKAVITSGTCASATYSGATTVATKITDNLAALPNGPVTLCVIGGDHLNAFQSPADAVSVTWEKDSLSNLNITSATMNRVDEGSGSHTITVALTPAKNYDVVAYYKVTGDAVNPDHHDLTSGFVTLPAGTSTANITVNFPDNNFVDGETLLNVHFTHTNQPSTAVLGQHYMAQYFIADDEKNLKASQLSLSRFHSCAIMEDNSLRCWGNNHARQIASADNNFKDSAHVITIAGVTGFRSVATGAAHTCAVTLDNRLFCWGDSNEGQVGGGSSSGYQFTPLHIDTDTTYLSVVAGELYSCAITTDNKLKCWGRNSYGQLGVDSTTEMTVPTEVTPGTTYKYVAAGSQSTCAITSDDKLFCWGFNAYYQLGDGTTTWKQIPVAVDSTESYKKVAVGSKHSCGITTSDKMKCWGNNSRGSVGDNTTTNRTTPVAVNAAVSYKDVTVNDDSTDARSFTCAITLDNDLQCWGYNVYMQLADGTVTQRNSPVAADTGTTYAQVKNAGSRACGITTAGALKCWGNLVGDQSPYNAYTYGSGNYYHAYSPTLQPATEWNFSKLSVYAGESYSDYAVSTCGLDSNKLYCWGSMSFNAGPFGDGTKVDVRRPGPVLIDPNTNYSYIPPKRHADFCAITSTGQMKCWGTNTNGELGEAAAVGQKAFVPTLADNTDTYSKVISYNNATCGITTTGVLKCAGLNTLGRLGLGDTVARTSFTIVDSGVTYSHIDLGTNHACGITTDGVLKCWGSNSAGQIAKPSGTSSIYLPSEVDAGVTYSKISLGPNHTCGITTANKLKCWGDNGNGKLGDGTMVNKYTPTEIESSLDYTDISAAPTHTCGITGGTLKCWGNATASGLSSAGYSGSSTVFNIPLPVDEGTTYTSVSSANFSTCAKTSSGEMRCVGRAFGGNFGFVDGAVNKNMSLTLDAVHLPTYIHKWQGFAP